MLYKNKQALIDQFKNNPTILDVGFFGQGKTRDDDNWVHKLLSKRTKNLYGLDLEFNGSFFDSKNYFKMSAEDFLIDIKFDVIFAGDLIEHLPNPGLFLDRAKLHLKEDGVLFITTPNCFSLFNILEKITKKEPTVNKDHTLYFNHTTLRQLLQKKDWVVSEASYLYSLELGHKESFRKKLQNILYYIISKFTYKFMETIVVIAHPKK